MLRKFAIFLIPILYLFLVFKVNAQVDILQFVDKDQDIPGVTCGDGSNKKINRCCAVKDYSDINSLIQEPDPGFFCLPFTSWCASDIPISAIRSFLNNSEAQKRIEQLGKLAKQGEGCVVGEASNSGGPNCTCKAEALESLCGRYLIGSPELNKCNECTKNNGGVWTGLGCINVTPVGFSQTIMGLGISLAGIASMLCIIYAAFMLQTSRGNTDRIKKAREYLTSCILGLILILSSVFILRILGITILKIPGLS